MYSIGSLGHDTHLHKSLNIASINSITSLECITEDSTLKNREGTLTNDGCKEVLRNQTTIEMHNLDNNDQEFDHYQPTQ